MKKIILASACIMALANGGAFAQTQPAPGASGQGDVGPSSRGPATKGMTTGTSSNMQNEAADSKGKQAPSAGQGRQCAKISAVSAMKPFPAVINGRKPAACDTER